MRKPLFFQSNLTKTNFQEYEQKQLIEFIKTGHIHFSAAIYAVIVLHKIYI